MPASLRHAPTDPDIPTRSTTVGRELADTHATMFLLEFGGSVRMLWTWVWKTANSSRLDRSSYTIVEPSIRLEGGKLERSM